MKAMRPEDRNKGIILVVLVVVVFGLIVVRAMSALGGGGPAPADQSQVIPVGASAPASGSGSPAPAQTGGSIPVTTSPTTGPDAGQIDVPAIKNPGKSNPFAPPKLQPVVKPPTTEVKPIQPLPPTGNPDKTNIPFPIDKEHVDIVKAAPPPIRVTGVVTGGRGIAVIRVGTRDFVVFQGDTFANGFKLVSVTLDQCVISHKDYGKQTYGVALVLPPTDSVVPTGTTTPPGNTGTAVTAS